MSTPTHYAHMPVTVDVPAGVHLAVYRNAAHYSDQSEDWMELERYGGFTATQVAAIEAAGGEVFDTAAAYLAWRGAEITETTEQP